MQTKLERELKLETPEDFELSRLPLQLNGFDSTPTEIARLHTIYYDTDDYRLARWGASLRYRHAEGWTLKIPVASEDGALAREERTFESPQEIVPGQALDLATAFTRGRPLAPVTELRTIRTKRDLRDASGAKVAEIVEDDVHVIEQMHVSKRFRQIEIELDDGTEERVLKKIRHALQDCGAGDRDALPKNVRALGLSRADELDLPDIGKRSSIGDVFRATFGRAVQDLVRNDAKLRVRSDEDAIHQARVAVRKLRSHLRTFESVLDPHWAGSLRARLERIGDRLGEARNADVMLNRIEADAQEIEEDATALLEPLKREQERTHSSVSAMLREGQYITLLDDVIDAAKRPFFLAGTADKAGDVDRDVVGRVWRKLRKTVRQRSRPPSDEDLHEIRKKAKNLRYAAEAFEPVRGKLARVARSAERLQTLLGDQHDAVAASRLLKGKALASAAEFLAAQLAVREHVTSRDGRRRWKRCWRRVGAI